MPVHETQPCKDRPSRRRHRRRRGAGPLPHGPSAHLQMRHREALAFRCRERGELPASDRLVHALPPHPRLSLLLGALAPLALSAAVLRDAARTGRRHRGDMGGGREHRLRHQPLSRDDDLPRLLRRQRHQFGERHSSSWCSASSWRRICRCGSPWPIARRARALRRRHDQGQSDAERADVPVAARLGSHWQQGR